MTFRNTIKYKLCVLVLLEEVLIHTSFQNHLLTYIQLMNNLRGIANKGITGPMESDEPNGILQSLEEIRY